MLKPHPEDLIQLLPSAAHVSYADVRRYRPDAVTACDFYVCGAETGIEVPGGYQLREILNIDHHAPVARMARLVSSANLAIAQVNHHGLPSGRVVINHTDCDSILSAGIASGVLEPLAEYGEAALAADHTGAVNRIADLLQALDDCRDVALSFRSLERLRTGSPLESVAQKAWTARGVLRDQAESAVAAGRLPVSGGVAFGVLDGDIDGEFFPSLLPDAAVIVVATPMKNVAASRWVMKMRLGVAAEAGLTLDALNLSEFDAAYGGRWDAGSNKRGGGTDRDPQAYAQEIRKRLEAWVAASSRRMEPVSG